MGRPREFDVDQAIRIATDLFWRKGFEGTSVSDLTRAMGIATPSFYFAFENKEALFQRIVESYQKTQAKIVEDALSQKTTKAVVEKLLGGFADLLTDPDHAPGCLIMNSALPVVEGHGFRILFAKQRQALRLRLQERFKQAVKDPSDLPADSDPGGLAQMVVALIWGFAVEAQSGASRAKLRKAAIAATVMWPMPKKC